jgi:uncharacterized protein (TIGR02001 family)
MSPELRLRSIVISLAAAALFSNSAVAQTPAPSAASAPGVAPAPEPDWTFTGNVGLFSQYVFRGLTQTNEKPAVQGGFDLGHKSGFYAGTWASNISWVSDAYPPSAPPPAPSANLEWDFYGGYKGSLPMDFGYDLGVLYYWYPGKYPTGFTKPNTTELYAALTWKFLSFKYSWSANDKTFGIPDSRGSQYLDLTASYDIIEKVSDVIGKVTIFGHLGKQYFHANSIFTYADWKVGASTEIYGLTVGIYGTGTNAQASVYTNNYGTDISKNQFVAYVQKTF